MAYVLVPEGGEQRECLVVHEPGQVLNMCGLVDVRGNVRSALLQRPLRVPRRRPERHLQRRRDRLTRELQRVFARCLRD